MLDTLLIDVRRAWRQARRKPGASAAIVLTLALAIGASTAIFSLLSAVVLRALPFEHATRLLWIAAVRPAGTEGPFSLPEYIDYRDRVTTLEHLVAYATWNANLTGSGYGERLQGLRMSANAFVALGVQPARGRLLAPFDDRPGAQRVAVLGYELWRRHFGADDAIVGQTLRLNGEPSVVVGVLPRHFPLPQRDIDVVVPLAADQDSVRGVRASASFLRFIGLLARGADTATATHELNDISAQLRQRFPVEYARKLGVRMAPLQNELVGDSRKTLLLIFAAVLLVLAMACANVISLLLARAVERRREIAVRVALGASRRAVVRQLLVEGGLHAIAGGIGGMLVTVWGLRALVAIAPPTLPRLSEVALDARMLGFTALVTLTVALLFGIAPAAQTFQLGLGENLMSLRAPFGGARQHRLRRRLIVAEIAIAVILLVASGLIVGSLVRLQRVDPGFATKDVLVGRVSLLRSKYTKREQLVQFHDRFLERLRSLPGVRGAGTISVAPLSGNSASTQFTIEGRPWRSPGDAPEVQFRLISPGYLDAAGTRLVRGRNILESDRGEAPPVALVNEALAERFLGQEPLGQRIRIDDNSQGPRAVEVVGIVANVKHTALEAAPTNDVYLAWAQAHADHVPFLTNYQFWAVRVDGDPADLGEAFRRELASIDPDAATSQLRTFQQYLDTSLAARRFSVFLMAAFAIAALMLATTGLYAVVAYAVSQQAGEIGVRIAVGARPWDIHRLVLGQATGLIATGVALGLVVSILGQRIIASLLFGTSAGDPRVLLGAALAETTVALAASYLPARRAARVDPIVTLRTE